MRSLGQLEPVHVILRRVDAWFCDPLELNPDSQLGVPGLVEAARSGGVSIVNPLGSSVLENPALMAFLPRLSEHLLGRAARAAERPDVVVRRGRRLASRARQPRPARAATDLAQRRDAVAVRLGAECRRARPVHAPHRGPTARLGRPGAAGDGERSDAHADRPRSPPQRPARVRGPAQRLVRCDARRLDARAPAATSRASPTRPARSARTPGCSRPSPRRLTGFWLDSGPAVRRSTRWPRSRRAPLRTCGGLAATPSVQRRSPACCGR